MEKNNYNQCNLVSDNKEDGAFLVRRIIQERSLATAFQPIISIKSHSIIGLEALSRGIQPITSNIVPPNILFEQATKLNMTIELDRLCRDKAFSRFNSLYAGNKDLFLFVNFDTTIIDKGVGGSGHLINSVKESGLPPENIVIEVCESRTSDLDALQQFICRHKQYGFLIALDDVGVGSSNLDRILLVKPDIIKIDRCLVSNVDQDSYKQEIFSSIVNMSKKIGALVVAEGIETEAEAVASCDLGADFLQGYYFARPLAADVIKFDDFYNIIQDVSRNFREHKVKKVASQVWLQELYQQIAQDVVTELAGVDIAAFDSKLREIVCHHRIECIYILDNNGIQISESVYDANRYPAQSKALFQAANKGTDQSLKDYYIYIHAGREQYITDPYTSYMSGNLCLTIATLLKHGDQCPYIVCIDFPANNII